jgi:hypothetical protein
VRIPDGPSPCSTLRGLSGLLDASQYLQATGRNDDLGAGRLYLVPCDGNGGVELCQPQLAPFPAWEQEGDVAVVGVAIELYPQ